MTQLMFLEPAEVRALTNRTQRVAQAAALRAMGIEHKIRPDGSVAVLRSHVEQQMGGGAARNDGKQSEPDWEAVA